MALQKQVIDMQAADGLQQKIDIRRLPSGKAAKALNLVKNKQGRLEKRNGFLPLAGTDPLGSGYSFNAGINLGTWNQDVTVIGRGTWAASGNSVTALSTYSDDLGGMVHRGQLPDLKVTADSILADTPTIAHSPTTTIIGDYAVMVWNDGPVSGTDTIQTGSLYWAAWELSTGNIIKPATGVGVTTGVDYFRLASVGNTWVLCLCGVGAGTIYCGVLPLATLKTGGTWNTAPLVTDQCTVAPSGTPFDMRSVSGDSTAFVLAYEVGTGGAGNPTPFSIVVRRYTTSGGTPVSTNTFTAQASPSASIGQVAFGVRADATSGRCAIVYCQPTSLTFPDPATVFKVHAASCVYPSMAFVNGSSTNDTIIYSGTNVHEPWPLWIDVVQNGTGGLPLLGPGTGTWWTAAWSPEGSVWNNQAQESGTAQTNVNRIVNTAAAKTPPIASRCARIIANTFQDGNNSLTLGNAGTTASITPGLILASRGLEANGIAYFLGWIPSITQGGFIALAYDQMKNQVQSGTGFPMRPVGALQTRTALGDPGFGSMINDTGALYTNASVSPNQWTGASEWQVGSDIYATSYVAYVAGTQGARFQPAYGAIQTTPLTGYPMAQWGTVTGIGGGLPMCFDGQSVFEQGFLWSPESILVDPGSATTPSSNQLLGPYWTTATTDSYSWIFTWEQFDTQGNFHISARSTPVTISTGQLVTYDGSGGGNGYRQPKFYIPTLGATYRQQYGASTSTDTFINTTSPPTYVPTLGVYRTARNGLIYYRVADRYFNGSDAGVSGLNALPQNVTDNSMFVTFVDKAVDQAALTQWHSDGGAATAPAYTLDGGTFPLLYGDGSNGAPGSLDNFCPPSSIIQIRHKERLFVARGNEVLFTKQRGELSGPGYNEQINAFFVGDSTPIIGMESMDDKLIIFKPNQLYYVAGDGPFDDGTGSSFQPPQPIPTDSGCSDPASIRSTPEGVYFMSTAGLRRLSRSLGVEYVGGPVEDELAAFSDVRSVVLYPNQNRVVFAVTSDDTGAAGEMIWRDYVLDAWTTAVVVDGTQQNAVALAVANAPRFGTPPNTQVPVLYFITSSGTVYRERDPNLSQPYYDNNTYISSTWQSPYIKQSDSSRFRLWDMFVVGHSADPHGLVVVITRDDGTQPVDYTWTWNSATGLYNIAPGGSLPTGLTRLRNYDGRMGTSFQVTVQDVSDTSSVSGQGLQLLGLSLAIGAMPGPFKTSPSSTQ